MAGSTITLNKSGTTSSGTYLEGKVEWSAKADNNANDSDLTATIYVRKDNDSITLSEATVGTWSWSMTINGTKKSGTLYASVLTGWVKLATVTVNNIAHGSDGKKSITIVGSVTGPSGTNLSGKTTSKSTTVNFDTIPRASTLDSLSFATNYFTGKLTYKYTPQSASFYNRCNIALNIDGSYKAVKTIDLGQKSEAQQTATVTLSSSELKTIYDLLPNTIVGTLRFTLRTFSDSGYSNQVGDAVYKEVTLRIPASAAWPLLSIPAPKPSSSLGSAFSGLYIQGKTKVTDSFSAVPQHGATITSQTVEVDGKTYEVDGKFTTDYLSTAGAQWIAYSAEDSNGYSNSTTKAITVLPYSKPKILDVSAARCDASKNHSDSGTYLQIYARRSYSKVVSGGVQKNFCKIQYRIKEDGGSWPSAWTVILASGETVADAVETGALLNGNLSVEKSYTVQVAAADDIGEMAVVEIDIPTDRVYMHRDGARRSLGIGKYAEEENTVDIAEDMMVKARGGLVVGSDVDVTISDTGWISLGLSDQVSESESNVGRNGKGCYYRVINENHVYVAFNCACEFAGELLRVNGDVIPEKYCPARNAYALVPTGGRSIVRVIANHGGNVLFEWVQIMSSAEQTTASSVKWIDGYIDYWI